MHRPEQRLFLRIVHYQDRSVVTAFMQEPQPSGDAERDARRTKSLRETILRGGKQTLWQLL